MIVYFSILAIMGMLFTVRSSNLVQTDRTRNLIYWLVWTILFAVVAFRYNVGTDYKYYRYNYQYEYADTFFGALTSKDAIGASLLTWISHLIYDDYATFFFLGAFICIIPCGIMVKNHSIAPCMSTVLFVLLGCWHATFVVVLQYAAVGILTIGYRYLIERKFWRWCIICVAASIFHITTLIMIPVYFIAQPYVNWRRIGLILLIGLVISLAYDPLFSLMVFLGGESMVGLEDTSFAAEQLNLLRVLVQCAPAVFATVLLNYYDCTDKRFALLYNLSLFHAVLCIGTMNSAYLNRFTMYTAYYNVFFIPYLVKPFARKMRVFIWSVMLILYGIFWAYDLYKGTDTVVFQWIFQRGV